MTYEERGQALIKRARKRLEVVDDGDVAAMKCKDGWAVVTPDNIHLCHTKERAIRCASEAFQALEGA